MPPAYRHQTKKVFEVPSVCGSGYSPPSPKTAFPFNGTIPVDEGRRTILKLVFSSRKQHAQTVPIMYGLEHHYLSFHNPVDGASTRVHPPRLDHAKKCKAVAEGPSRSCGPFFVQNLVLRQLMSMILGTYPSCVCRSIFCFSEKGDVRLTSVFPSLSPGYSPPPNARPVSVLAQMARWGRIPHP